MDAMVIGLDTHRKFSTIVARDSTGHIVEHGRLEHHDRAKLRAQLQRYAKGSVVVIEASFGWSWLSDEVARAGLVPRLANAKKVDAWRKGRGMAKTNRKDAELLSELPLEREPWWEVWLPPAELRDEREWIRLRYQQVRVQTSLKNQIHSVLHRHGILHEYSDLFGVAGRRFLSLLVTSASDEDLPPMARQTLKERLILLDQVQRCLARATRAVRRQWQADPVVRLLRTLPGVGWILAMTIRAEIGEIKRFASSRHLSSYASLAPRASDTGEETDDIPQNRHVGHLGRLTLKWAFIEAAHGAVRKDERLRDLFNRRTDNGRRDRSKGYVAVAHHLCKITYAMWRHQKDYDPEGPRAPGREAK